MSYNNVNLVSHNNVKVMTHKNLNLVIHEQRECSDISQQQHAIAAAVDIVH